MSSPRTLTTAKRAAEAVSGGSNERETGPRKRSLCDRRAVGAAKRSRRGRELAERRRSTKRRRKDATPAPGDEPHPRRPKRGRLPAGGQTAVAAAAEADATPRAPVDAADLLPREIWTAVLSAVHPDHIPNAQLVCREFDAICRDAHVWRLLYRRFVGREMSALEYGILPWVRDWHFFGNEAAFLRWMLATCLHPLPRMWRDRCRFSGYGTRHVNRGSRGERLYRAAFRNGHALPGVLVCVDHRAGIVTAGVFGIDGASRGAAVVRSWDGATYIGPLDHRKRQHGFGRLTLSSGDEHEVEWFKGRALGWGSYRFALPTAGGIAEVLGSWAGDGVGGRATLLMANGDRCVAALAGGIPHSVLSHRVSRSCPDRVFAGTGFYARWSVACVAGSGLVTGCYVWWPEDPTTPERARFREYVRRGLSPWHGIALDFIRRRLGLASATATGPRREEFVPAPDGGASRPSTAGR